MPSGTESSRSRTAFRGIPRRPRSRDRQPRHLPAVPRSTICFRTAGYSTRPVSLPTSRLSSPARYGGSPASAASRKANSAMSRSARFASGFAREPLFGKILPINGEILPEATILERCLTRSFKPQNCISRCFSISYMELTLSGRGLARSSLYLANDIDGRSVFDISRERVHERRSPQNRRTSRQPSSEPPCVGAHGRAESVAGHDSQGVQLRSRRPRSERNHLCGRPKGGQALRQRECRFDRRGRCPGGMQRERSRDDRLPQPRLPGPPPCVLRWALAPTQTTRR